MENTNLAFRGVSMYTSEVVDVSESGLRAATLSGAIGFDWVIVDQGGVSWLISRPRKSADQTITATPQYSLAA